MNFKQSFFALLCLTVAVSAFADENLLVTAKTPDGKINVPIYILTDASGNLAGMKASGKTFDAKQFRKGCDLNVKGYSGIVVVYADQDAVDLTKGGKLRIQYDPNKVNPFASKRNFYIDIRKGGDGKWHLYNGGKQVTNLAVQPASNGVESISPVAMLAEQPDGGTLDGGLPQAPQRTPAVEDDQRMAKFAVPAAAEAASDAGSPDSGTSAPAGDEMLRIQAI
ncbi:MAG: hypothetical protein HY075_05860 [Deltaproteobacteria bacterium]|nr:hypothetical protein [Deltaproteobacteria bacterium]